MHNYFSHLLFNSSVSDLHVSTYRITFLIVWCTWFSRFSSIWSSYFCCIMTDALYFLSSFFIASSQHNKQETRLHCLFLPFPPFPSPSLLYLHTLFFTICLSLQYPSCFIVATLLAHEIFERQGNLLNIGKAILTTSRSRPLAKHFFVKILQSPCPPHISL